MFQQLFSVRRLFASIAKPHSPMNLDHDGGDRHKCFRYIQSNENFATLIHVLSSALRKGPPHGSNPRRMRSMERETFISTDMRSYDSTARKV